MNYHTLTDYFLCLPMYCYEKSLNFKEANICQDFLARFHQKPKFNQEKRKLFQNINDYFGDFFIKPHFIKFICVEEKSFNISIQLINKNRSILNCINKGSFVNKYIRLVQTCPLLTISRRINIASRRQVGEKKYKIIKPSPEEFENVLLLLLIQQLDRLGNQSRLLYVLSQYIDNVNDIRTSCKLDEIALDYVNSTIFICLEKELLFIASESGIDDITANELRYILDKIF